MVNHLVKPKHFTLQWHITERCNWQCKHCYQDKNFIHLKTIEIIEREWDVQGRKVRPKSQPIGHSGFLTFVRKI